MESCVFVFVICCFFVCVCCFLPVLLGIHAFSYAENPINPKP